MTIIRKRQDELNHIITDALKDPNLHEALQVFSMGQNEYSRAIASLKTIKINSGNTANPGDKQNANLGENQRRD